MQITAIDAFPLTIPFADGGAGFGLTPNRWCNFETVLLRVTAANGLTG